MQDVGLMEEGKLYVTAESALFNQENNSFLEARILLLWASRLLPTSHWADMSHDHR